MYTVIRRDAAPVSITFIPDNGEESFTKSVHPGSSVEKPDDPVKRGFEFLGWYPATDGEGTADTPYDFQSIVTEAFALRAKWKEIPAYTVSFDSRGGSEVPPQTVLAGESAEEPDEPVFDDHIFLGWYLPSDGTPVRYSFSMPVTRDIGLTALWEEITYETCAVTFDSGGGSDVPSQTVISGARAVRPADPVRYGYEFLGWYLLMDDATEDEPYDFDQAITGNITLRAKWKEIPRYTVAFLCDGGSPEPAEQSVYEGENAARPEMPVKADYLFIDWFRLEGGNPADRPFEFEETAVTENITLIALWEKIPKYTVTFDSNGGSEVPSQTVLSGARASRPDDPESADGNYSFDAWYEVRDDGTLADTAYDFTSAVTADITLKAQWKAGTIVKHTVTFVIDYEGFHVDFEQPVLDGSCAVRVSDPSRRGYTFDGWLTEDSEAYLFDQPVTADITLLAAWTPIAAFTVEFDSDGGSEVASQSIFAGEKAYRPDDPVKQDSIFLGWYLLEEPYDFSAPVERDITVKAKWLNLYTVVFDCDGGIPVDPQKVESGRKAANPGVCYRNSYVFDGWYLVKDDGETEEDRFDFDNTIILKSITLRAGWIPVYVVKFDIGSSEFMKTVPVISGNPVDRPDQDPEREGFHFKGWRRKTDEGIAEEPFDFAQAIKADTTLVAEWTPVYIVIFDADGGIPPVRPQEVENGDFAVKPEEHPKKDNWFFCGWYQLTSEGMAEKAFTFNKTPITESITLRAKWVDDVVTLPSALVSLKSGAFAGVVSAQAIRLPEDLADFQEDSFEEGAILLAPKGSASWNRAKELGLNVEEE